MQHTCIEAYHAGNQPNHLRCNTRKYLKNNGKELNNYRMYMTTVCMPNIYLHNKIDMGRRLLKRNYILMCINCLHIELCCQ